MSECVVAGRPGASSDTAIARILARIANDRPAAIAGPAPFWARITDLPLTDVTAALEALVAQGVVRCQPLGDQLFFIADPPHAGPGTPR